MECQATGTPLPQVTWTKDGQLTQASEHFVIETLSNGTHRLIIKNAQKSHGGIYTANVKHKVQTQRMNFNVIVTGK